jgi:colanic acid biosynthesis glycosyl transferase WcaI
VKDAKMVLVHNWVDINFITPISRDNAFSQELHLSNRFVVLYAGNIGLSQGLEHVLTAAEKLSPYPDIFFIFVGDGSGREKLRQRVEKNGVPNVLFLPFQPRSRLPEVLATANVSLVILRRGIGTGSLPSKMFSILASGRPVIASIDEGCETWTMVEKAQAGLCVPPENPAALVKAILTLKQDQGLCERLGRNGRAWAEQHHSPQAAAEQFEKLFMDASAARVQRLIN